MRRVAGNRAGKGFFSNAGTGESKAGVDRNAAPLYIQRNIDLLICKNHRHDCKNYLNSYVISVASMGNGVTVAQQTLTLFV